MTRIYDNLSRDTVGATDTLCAMMQKERRVKRSRYLISQKSCSLGNDDVVTAADRMTMVDWCYSIVDTCYFDRESVAVAMDMVDRFLSIPAKCKQIYLRDKKQYQLLTIGALYMAIKTSEPTIFGSDVFAATSAGIYSVQEIEDMEMIILEGLEWRIIASTSIQMAHYILSVIMPHVDLEESALEFILDELRFQTEYAVRDYYFTTQRASTVAVAAILNTLDQGDHRVNHQVLDAMVFVLDENFASPAEIIAAKERLTSLMDSDDCVEESVCTLSESSIKNEISFSNSFDTQETGNLNDLPKCITTCHSVTPTYYEQNESSCWRRTHSF